MMKKYFLYLLLMLCSVSYSWGQARKLSGVVKDDKGGELPGASVVVKGTTTGTMTGMNGEFSLANAKKGDIIVFSFVGMASQEIKWDGSKVLNVTLKDDSKMLDDLVVVAYGSTRKKDLTGALSTMKPDLAEAAAATSVDGLLGGKVAGLVVNAAAATPGAASSVTIRGASSLRGDNQPLYVIDNIPQASTGEFAGSGINSDFQVAQDPLSSLNPNDIENITVLKDASSTAIYGSRGANGVILITTKKGRRGKARVNASANFTIAEATRLIPMVNLSEYADFMNARVNDGRYQYYKAKDGVRYVFNENIDKYIAEPNNSENYRLLEEHNWQKELYRSALSQNYSLTVNGGADKITYYLSGNFRNVEGIVRATGLKQGDLRANLSADLTSRLKLNVSLSGSIRENNMMSGGSTLGGATSAASRMALDQRPFFIVNPSDSEAFQASIEDWITDYVDLAQDRTFKASADLTWRISDRFSYNLRTGANLNNNERNRWYGKKLYHGQNNNGYLSNSHLEKSNFTIENVLNYNVQLGKDIRLDATAGITYDDYNFLNRITIGTNFSSYQFQEKGMHKAQTVTPMMPIQKDYQLLSYLGRINLSLWDKLLLTASLRADGSSKFAKGNRWGFFPSASVAYRLEQEEFIKSLGVFEQLKLRLSYGVTGNQAIDPYQTFSTYATDPKKSYGNGTGGAVHTLVISNLSNSGLKWEQTASWNAGLDFSLLGSRLSGSLDFYTKKTSDLLISRQLPGSAGFASTLYNQGGLENKGFELSLKADILKSKTWNWTVSGNIGVNKSRITDLGMDPIQMGALGARVGYYGNRIGDKLGAESHVFLSGEAPGLFFGLQTQGIIRPEDVTDQGIRYTKPDGTDGYYTKANNVTPKAGDLRFVDLNGDGIVDSKDRTIIGDPNPDFTYGIQTRLAYKSLYLSAAFTGVQGIDRFNTNTFYIGLLNKDVTNITRDAFANMWSLENLNGTQPAITYGRADGTIDRYIEDASYLRLSDLTLGYTLPAKLTKKFGVQNLALTFSVKNVFVITNYTGYDPEVNSMAFDGLRPGVDLSSFPTPRSFVLGLNVAL